MAPTLNLGDNTGDTRATTLIVFYGNRVADIRIQGDVINTLQARMETGGNNMPIVVYPIQDGRDMEKKQNGLGVGEAGDPANTLDRTGAQSVAIAFDTQFGSNANTFEDQAPTLKSTQQPPSIAYSVREDAKADTFSATETEIALAIQAHQPSPQSHHAQLFIAERRSIVRRLTPTECERLQGFPDGWTADQTDGHRYKQLGNAVAVPCVSYIVERMVKTLG